jgi:hypothetical protein
MSQVKFLEIRDHGTFIPMMAIALQANSSGKIAPGLPGPQETYLLRRAGYAPDERYIWLSGLSGGVERGTSDPYEWGTRTRKVAHDYIIQNWDTIEPGQVIDVEFILGHRDKPKISEREAEGELPPV